MASINGTREPDESPPSASQEEEEPFVVPIEESIDLHHFRPAEILPVVDAYIEAALEAGFREVRLIHGRGKGVQRNRVQQILAGHPGVERFTDAPAHQGGWGATIAWLILPGATD